jgi:hypothetical protein
MMCLCLAFLWFEVVRGAFNAASCVASGVLCMLWQLRTQLRPAVH